MNYLGGFRSWRGKKEREQPGQGSWAVAPFLSEALKVKGLQYTVEPACKVSVLSNESWPYKRVDLISGLLISIRVLWLGPAKNWPYKRVDLTSVDHISGLDCTSNVTLKKIHCFWTVHDWQLCLNLSVKVNESAWNDAHFRIITTRSGFNALFSLLPPLHCAVPKVCF